MRREIPAVRIFPMSDKMPGFAGLSIEQVQRKFFQNQLPKSGGRWRYVSSGLNADPNTIVLFQFKARIIASAVFLRDEKFEKPKRGCAGELWFDPQSIRTFGPLDVIAMRKIWPSFRGFGHVKQFLNPTAFSRFKSHWKRSSLH